MKQKVKPHPRAFTIKYPGLANRIITAVSLTPAFDPAEHTKPPYPLFSAQALWDTGATNSVITSAAATGMSLVSVGPTMVAHGGGIQETNTYMVNILLPNNVGMAGVRVAELGNDVGDFGVIIGMDIISGSDFSITNVDGETWMTFRIPSLQRIDYVVEANKVIYAGTVRNAPCPCGSGKKYKRCHGA